MQKPKKIGEFIVRQANMTTNYIEPKTKTQYCISNRLKKTICTELWDDMKRHVCRGLLYDFKVHDIELRDQELNGYKEYIQMFLRSLELDLRKQGFVL
jgi:hypothetical protein